jgi:pimeloyl-ACP methyl ester carboxylesterase
MVWETFWHRYLKRPYRLRKVIDQGEGPINIVLIHGLASSSSIWQPLIQILDAKKYRIRSYDLLGFGMSPKPGFLKYSTKEHAKAIIHTLSAEEAKGQKFIFIGHSMGCIIASHIAYRRPSRVEHLILYKPPLLDFEEGRSFYRKFYRYLAKKPASLAWFVRFSGRYSDKLAGFKTDDEYWLPIANSLNNTILAQQTLLELEKITKPIDVIYGRFDFLVSTIKAKKLAAINPKLKLHKVAEMHDVKPKSSRYIKNLIDSYYK